MSGLSADALRIPVTDVESAAAFYGLVFCAALTSDAVQTVSLHGTGTIELMQCDTSLASRFGRVVAVYVLDQPSEVRALMDAAVAQGARVLKPAKKALFGSFSGSFSAPDGLIWKVTSAKGKDTGPATAVPRPTETSLILGVSKPTLSRDFYTGLGMEPDRDYGDKYIDFRPPAGGARLCLMHSGVLAKDVGIPDTSEAPDIAFTHRARSGEDVAHLAAAAAAAGGRVLSTGARDEQTVTDPDGFHWTVTAVGTAETTFAH